MLIFFVGWYKPDIWVLVYISNLILTNFKNYASQQVRFNAGLNLLFGNNGSGKTNILDAINYLALTKSHFVPQDKMAVKYDTDFFRLEGKFEYGSSSLNVILKYQTGQKKIEVNDRPILKQGDHVGAIGIVFIAPDDLEIIDGLSALRRKYMDTSLAQSDHEYLVQLGTYKKLLEQRNSYLKQAEVPDAIYLQVLNEKMAPCAHYIYQQRKKFCEVLVPTFINYYAEISDHKEKVDIRYITDLDKFDFLELMFESERIDLRNRITNKGIHRDDLAFTIFDHDARYTASQGQKKTFLVGLFLAQADFLCHTMASDPILLLDDVFDKLDQNRMHYLLATLHSEKKRQIILTDTSRDRLSTIIKSVSSQANYLEVKNATVLTID